MINKTKEYNKKEVEYNINYLIDNKIEEEINNITPQSIFSNSDNMNKSFDNIEKAINKLYEKTRIVQDVFAYAKYYIQENLHNITAECKSIINTIETDRDKIKSYEYNTIPVILLDKQELHNDRNGENLFSCDLENDKLVPSNKREEQIKIKSIEKIKGFTPYKNNIEDLAKDKPYRSFYLMDGAGTNGLKEELLITLEKPSVANSLKIKTSNCTIESVSYIDQNDNKIMISKFNGFINSKEPIKQILLSINCNKYKQKSYAIDIQRLKDNDFWEKVKEERYREETGAASIYDLEKLSGIKDNIRDYDHFVDGVQKWENKYIKYKIDHNEWEEKKTFFGTLRDTTIKGEADWDDIIVSPDSQKIKLHDIFKDDKLINNAVKLAKRFPDGHIEYIDISKMTEKEVRNNLANDPSIFLINPDDKTEPTKSPIISKNNAISNINSLNAMAKKGIQPSVKQLIIAEEYYAVRFDALLSSTAESVVQIVPYNKNDIGKIQCLIDETDGVNVLMAGDKLKDIDYKNASVVSVTEAASIINKANNIVSKGGR